MIDNPTANLNKKKHYINHWQQKKPSYPILEASGGNSMIWDTTVISDITGRSLTFALAYKREDTYGATFLTAFTRFEPDRNVIHAGLVTDEVE